MTSLFALTACLAPPADVESDASPDAPDAPLPDAVAGEVTVVVTGGGVPRGNAAVLFHDSDGTWIETLYTDASGRVVRRVDVGSAITVISGTSPEGWTPRLWTIFGVEAGDVLTFEDTPQTEVAGNVELSWPLPPDGCPVGLGGPTGGAGGGVLTSPYTASFGWTGSYNSAVWFTASCPGVDPTPHSVMSIDIAPGYPATYTRAFSEFSTAMSDTDVTFEGLPTEGVVGTFELQVAGGWYVFWRTEALVADGPLWNRRIPGTPLDTYREHVKVYREDDESDFAHGYTLSSSTPRDGVVEEVEDWLPMLEVTERVIDPAGRHRISWHPESPFPSTVDGQLIQRDGWILVVPPDATSVVYPEIPPDLLAQIGNRRPPSAVKAFDVSNIATYREFRSGAHSVRDYGSAFEPLYAEAPAQGVRWDWSYGRLYRDELPIP